MFICDKCLEASYDNIGIFKSYGACEICNQVHTCNDIPSYGLRKKTKRPNFERGPDGTFYPTHSGAMIKTTPDN